VPRTLLALGRRCTLPRGRGRVTLEGAEQIPYEDRTAHQDPRALVAVRWIDELSRSFHDDPRILLYLRWINELRRRVHAFNHLFQCHVDTLEQLLDVSRVCRCGAARYYPMWNLIQHHLQQYPNGLAHN
jgi:hypothetical protein